MDIFLWANYQPEDKSLGITKKIHAQIQTLKKMGHKVTYSAYTNMGVAIFDNNDCIVEKRETLIRSQRLFRVLRMFYLIHFTCQYFYKVNKTYDLVIVRWTCLNRGVLKMLELMRKKAKKIVMDTHGYFKNQVGSSLVSKYTMWTTNKNMSKMPQYLDLVLTETNENEIFNVKAMKYDNGIDTNNIKPLEYHGKASEINMISVANERVYHGYDRLIKSMAAYQGNCTINLHLVGVVSKETVKLIEKLGLKDRTILHGKLYGEDLDNVYDMCNVAVGPICQHRIGGKQGTGLKTKEYFAKGIPYFYSGKELLVPDGFPYILKISSDESMIDFDEIEGFLKEISLPEATKNMREFALVNFTWEKVYNEMFSKLYG